MASRTDSARPAALTSDDTTFRGIDKCVCNQKGILPHRFQVSFCWQRPAIGPSEDFCDEFTARLLLKHEGALVL